METGASPKLCFTQAKLEKMMLDLNKILTRAVEDLKQQLRPPTGLPARRGVFDTLKNWWSNLRHGFQSSKNPYYHQNLMGHLGKPVAEMTLSEYKYLAEKASILENNVLILERKLQLDVELDRWLANLKSDLSSYFGSKLSRLAMQSKVKSEKETAKKLEKELKEKIPVAAADTEKSFFDKYKSAAQPDELLGLQEPAEEPEAVQGVARTPLDPEAAAALQRKIMPKFTGGETDAPPKKRGKTAKKDKVDAPVVNPAEVPSGATEPEVVAPVQPEKEIQVEKPIIMANLPKRQKFVKEPIDPMANLLQTAPPAGKPKSKPVIQPPADKPEIQGASNKNRPRLSGNFFGDATNYKNLQLNGLTLYEKTLVCLEKLRS